MKKIYSLAILAAMGSLAAFAGQRQQAAQFNLCSVKAQVSEQAAELNVKASDAAKAISKVEAITDLNGIYDWGFTSLLSSTPNPELTITITDEATGEATISGFPSKLAINATVDLTAGTVTIPNNQYLGKDSGGDDTYFYLKPVEGGNIGDGASDAAASVGTIGANGTTITFPALDVWALGDPDAENLGWWILTYNNELTVQKEKVLFGTATVSGDFYFSAFTGAEPEEDYEVEVYTSEDDPTTLLVKNPLKGLYATLGWNAESPDMIVDLTDKDNVLIDLFSLGINGGEDGLYYGLSVSRNQSNIANTPEQYRIKYAEDAEAKTATITMPEKSMYLLASATNKLYYGNMSEVTFTIPRTPSGVEVVAVEAEQAPVYYNLQGIRVNEPAAGQLIIKKQGDKVSKIIVK